MARTFIRQTTQIKNSDSYDDTITPTQTHYESDPTNIETDLNSVRSQLQNLINRNGGTFPSGNWWDDLTAPSSFESGAARGVQQLNSGLHDLERKRVLVSIANLTDVTVGAVDNFVILTLGQLPASTTAAIGAVTTLGTVGAAHGGTFGTHSVTVVAGSTAIAPKNICEIVDGTTRDPILSSTNKIIYGLFQTESSTDGSTMTGTTTNRAQISFVTLNSTGDALVAATASDIQGKTINYSTQKRVALTDLNEQDFLRGAILDNLGSTTATRQLGYDQQGTTPVELGNNAFLDIATGLAWEIRDNANASLFKITEGSTGGTTTILVAADTDQFTVNAIANTFNAGAKFANGGTRIDVGVNTGVIETTSTNDLRVLGAGELYLDDGNQAGSTWAQTSGIKLSDTTAEWDLFETNFGEVSILNAINQSRAKDRRSKTVVSVNTTVAADADVSLAAANIDVALPDMSAGTFISDYDVYLNGELLRGGATSAANNDYYPGTTSTALKFEFGLKSGDVISVVKYT
jgi:hypothetical protein